MKQLGDFNKAPIILGLTGSIGMGKSTTADLFAQKGIPIYSADTQVHKLYGQEPALSLVEAAFPGVIRDKKIDRELLSDYIIRQPDALEYLEEIIHPLLREREREFLRNVGDFGCRLAILDIPLLYETGADSRVDYVCVVSAPFIMQKQRVMVHRKMSEEKFNLILARQISDEEKRRRADFIIDTSEGVDKTRGMVDALCTFLMHDFIEDEL